MQFLQAPSPYEMAAECSPEHVGQSVRETPNRPAGTHNRLADRPHLLLTRTGDDAFSELRPLLRGKGPDIARVQIEAVVGHVAFLAMATLYRSRLIS